MSDATKKPYRTRVIEKIETQMEGWLSEHEITKYSPLVAEGGRFGWWKVQRPETNNFSFCISNMPGMVHIHGDIVNITVSRTLDTLFGWFPQVSNLHYFEEKVISRPNDRKEFSIEDAKEGLECLIEGYGDDVCDDETEYFNSLREAILSGECHDVFDRCDGDDIEYFIDCFEPDRNVIYGYFALKKFLELVE